MTATNSAIAATAVTDVTHDHIQSLTAAQAVAEAKQMEGVYYVRVWVNEGELRVGDDIMFVLIGADIRPHAVKALETLVGKIKSECVTEKELYAE